MTTFLKDNWIWLLVAAFILMLVLTVMRASKRKDSDIADSQEDENDKTESLEYDNWGHPVRDNRA